VGRELTVFLAHNLGEILAQQAKRPADGYHVNGGERLVQHQHARVQSRVRAGIHNGAAFHSGTPRLLDRVSGSPLVKRRGAKGLKGSTSSPSYRLLFHSRKSPRRAFG